MQVLPLHRSRFPQSFAFLEADLPLVRQNEPAVWHLFLKHSRLSNDEARTVLEQPSVPPLFYARNLGAVVWAVFDPDNPGRIDFSREVLQQFEASPHDPNARAFLRVKALHELCHWGCFQKRVFDPDTAGEEFEKEAFGIERSPWWLAPAAVAPPEVRDPVARAEALRSKLGQPGHVPGRLADPERRVFGGEDVAEGMARGYRNNNPGNIVRGDAWMGLAAPEEMTPFQRNERTFSVFREPEWGLRAMAYLLKKYKRQYGINTPRRIIERWAPASDGNDVDSYSKHLADALGVERDSVVDVDDEAQLLVMMRAIAKHENGGKAPYADMQFQTALLLLS